MIRSDFLIRHIQAAWQRKGLISTLLLPLSWLARLGIAYKKSQYRRHRFPVAKSRHPVVVVGNLYVGGTGKTPVVMAIVQSLQTHGWRPGVISRGYGIKPGSRARTGQGRLDPTQFGDEPALIAARSGVPVSVHPKRTLALRQLEHDYPNVDVVIADDGLQHLALARDLEIVVQDGRTLGNRRVLPAGPLREPANKLQEVDYLITNLDAGQAEPAPRPIKAVQISLRLVPTDMQHLNSNTTLPWPQWQSRHHGRSMGAVAGIGQPQRYFAMLAALGMELTETIALPDHHPFSTSPFAPLTSELILITAKDAVKCSRFNDERVWVVNVAPQFNNPGWLDGLNLRLRDIAKKKNQPTI